LSSQVKHSHAGAHRIRVCGVHRLIVLCNAQFLNNTALVDGGALILDGVEGSAVMMYGNTASGNQALGGRGGFALLTQTRTSCVDCFVRVVKSSFSANAAGALRALIQSGLVAPICAMII
jgi:hypothetical protein